MIKDRQGHIVKELEGQNKLLKKLYSTSAGRCALKILVSPFVTHLGGLHHFQRQVFPRLLKIMILI